MAPSSWTEPSLTSEQRDKLRHHLYATQRLHFIGLRTAIVSFAVGGICILVAEAISGVSLRAWIPLAVTAVAFGLLLAGLPMLIVGGTPPKHALDGDGVQFAPRRRLAWSQLRSFWVERSPIGMDVLQLLTVRGRVHPLTLPAPPLADAVVAQCRSHLPETPLGDRPTQVVLPEWLGALTYAVLVVGGGVSGIAAGVVLRSGVYWGLGMLAVVSLLFAGTLALVYQRHRKFGRDQVASLIAVFSMGISGVGMIMMAAWMLRSLS